MDNQYEAFMELFPAGTKIIKTRGTPDNFEAVLRCRCKDKEDFINWLRHYEDLCKVTFLVSVTRPRSGKTVLYKAVYRCEHNTYPKSHQRVKSPHPKHTDCPALLRVTIKSSVENRRVRSKDELRADYPTEITVIHKHNHKIMAAEGLTYRDISKEVKTKLIDTSHDHPAGADSWTWYHSLRALKTDIPICEDNTCSVLELDQPSTSTSPVILFDKQEEEDDVEPDWSVLEERLNFLIQKWKASNNSAVYYEELQKAVSYLESCKTETATISALHNIGKQFKARKYSTQINVQPTLVSRRIPQFEGRKCMPSGRPLKKSYQCQDHSYSKKKGEKRTRPHSLVTRIEKNM